MQQRGSKYDQKFKEEALALVASGVSITNAAFRLGIPKSTLSDWVNTQYEGDEDGAAARREVRRAQIRRCNRIVDKTLRAVEIKADTAASECRAVKNGLKVLEKAAEQGVIGLTEAEVASLRNIIADYTGTSMRELASVIKDVAARQEVLEAHLSEKEDAAPEVNLRLTLVDPTKAVDDGA